MCSCRSGKSLVVVLVNPYSLSSPRRNGFERFRLVPHLRLYFPRPSCMLAGAGLLERARLVLHTRARQPGVMPTSTMQAWAL